MQFNCSKDGVPVNDNILGLGLDCDDLGLNHQVTDTIFDRQQQDRGSNPGSVTCLNF